MADPGRVLVAVWPAAATGAVALGLYAASLAPGLTWAHAGADGGDFLAAALVGGVPHPTGYPAYQILLRGALSILPGDPARAGNWLSAVASAAAAALLAELTRRLLVQPAAPTPAPAAAGIRSSTPSWMTGLAASSAGLAWAASPALWSQAVITEAYALGALCFVLLLLLLWQWPRSQGRLVPFAAGLVFGAGLGVHLSLALILPGAALWLLPTNRGRSSLKKWAAAAGGMGLGLAVFAYLPLAARTAPPVNWGDPSTPAGFRWLVTGEIYRRYLFSIGANGLMERAAGWAGDAAREYAGGPWGALLALAGLWRLDRIQHRWWRLVVLTGVIYSAFAIGYNTVDSAVYLIPVWGLGAMCLGIAIAWGGEAVWKWTRSRGELLPHAFLAAALALVVLALSALSVLRHWDAMQLRNDREAADFVSGALEAAEPGALILTEEDQRTFALWYARYGLELRTDIAVLTASLYRYPWYRGTLALWHPELAPVDGIWPQLDDLVRIQATNRPVYRAERISTADFVGAIQEPAGPLVRVRWE